MASSPVARKRLEDLPDELLLCFCRYLSPLEIFSSFLGLNYRLNRTITFYRENIFLAHLSRAEFHELLDRYLTYLSPHVRCLHVDHRSMVNMGRDFERKFNRIDRQFPRLEKLIFHSIDIETLENLAWRFGTMPNLRELEINTADNRLLPMPGQFDPFLGGKLFASSNSFSSLNVNLNHYSFSMAFLHHRCENLRSLSIALRHLEDLLVLFEELPNIEQLNVTLGDSRPYESDSIEYSFDQLWWKVPHLTMFQLNIEQRELTSQNNILPSRLLFQIVKNLYSLVQMKFQMNIQFSSSLQHSTSKELYIETYFPYANGFLWQQALERNDNRTIHFHLHLELDATPLSSSETRVRFNEHARVETTSKIDPSEQSDASLSSVDHFQNLLKTTFCNQFWLQRDMLIRCCATKERHVSIYTIPLVNAALSTTIEMIQNDLSIDPFSSHRLVKKLRLHSNSPEHAPTMELKHLFSKFPYLNHLTLGVALQLPPAISIGSLRLHSLTLHNQSLVFGTELLRHLPNVRSLTIDLTGVLRLILSSGAQVIPSITRLRVITNALQEETLRKLIANFPNIVEFGATIRPRSTVSFVFSEVNTFFDCTLATWPRLRYAELTFYIRVDEVMRYQGGESSLLTNLKLTKTITNDAIRLEQWL